MSDPALQRRLGRIERLLYLVLAMLGGIYLYGFGVFVDFYTAGVLGVALLTLWFVVAGMLRRRRGETDGGFSDL